MATCRNLRWMCDSYLHCAKETPATRFPTLRHELRVLHDLLEQIGRFSPVVAELFFAVQRNFLLIAVRQAQHTLRFIT